jgi:lysophospholipid acyltransferase (LPLAT)-like uncharacterized protein
MIRSTPARWVLGRLAAGYIRLVYRTGRFSVEGEEHLARVRANGSLFIPCFWHGRLLLMASFWEPGSPVAVLASPHADGRLLAETVRLFGARVIDGSTRQGAASALRGCLAAIKAGESVVITPDGPRGPRMRASPGAVYIARFAGVPILPLSFSAAPSRRLRSWDRFLVPLPFARGALFCGEPIEVAANADEAAIEAARQTLEERLNALTLEADRRFGLPPLAPAAMDGD